MREGHTQLERELAELVARYHASRDKLEQTRLILLMAAELKEHDPPGTFSGPMVDRIAAILGSPAGEKRWPAPDTSPPVIARPEAPQAPMAGNGKMAGGHGYNRPRCRPELSSWPQPIAALALMVREFEEQFEEARLGRRFDDAGAIQQQLAVATRRLEQAKRATIGPV